MSIGEKAVKGAAWTIATSVGSRTVGLVGTLLIIRYLLPEDYGEVSAAAIVVGTANQLSTFGVGLYVITNPKAGRDVIFHATFWHLILGVLAVAAVMLLRGPLGPVFDAPTMGRFVPGLALAMFFDRVTFMPERVLVRDLRFRVISLSRTVGELSYTAVSVGMAMTGAGAMAIVWGNLARSFLRMLVTVAAADRRDWIEFHPLRRRTMAKLVSYGATVSIAGIAGFAARRWDNLLVSRFFGPAVMGAYNLAYNLADIPAVQVGEQIADVMQASFSHLPKEERGDALVRSTSLLGLIMFPLAVGLGATAPSIVHAFFPNKWIDVAPMLMLLSVLSVPRPIAGALGAYMHAMVRPRVVMWLEWFSLAFLLGAIVTFGRLGPRWTCLAVGVSFCARALAGLWVVQRMDGISMRKVLGGLLPSLVACVPLLATVIGVRHGLRALGVGPFGSLAVETVAGAFAYVLAALVIARRASRELLRLLRRSLERKAVATVEPAAGAP